MGNATGLVTFQKVNEGMNISLERESKKKKFETFDEI